MQFIFFVFLFASLFDVWVHFVVCCSFRAVTYHKKKERCFFYVTEQKNNYMCKIKGRVLKYKTSRKYVIFPPLPK